MLTTHTTPPLLETIVIDVPVRRGVRSLLAIDDRGVSWGDRRVGFDDVRSVSYAVKDRPINLVQRGVERRVELITDATALVMELGAHAFGPRFEASHADAYRSLVDRVHAAVEPRLCAEIARSIAIGDVVTVGGLDLHEHGVTQGSATLGWDRLPGALFESDHVVIDAAVPRFDEHSWRVPMRAPNAVLLPELIAACADAFS